MKFNYQARTKTGEVRSGIVEASSKAAALTLLRKQGFYVTILEKAEAVPFYARRIKFFERISKKEVVNFSRQLAIMFKSKISLIEALRTIAKQTRNPSFKEKILEISEAVEGGTSLSQALARFPNLFSSFYISTVKAGEKAGTLSQNLEYLAHYLEREYHFHSRIKGALIYPAIVFLVFLVILILMVFFVIPQLSEVLKEVSPQELPWISKAVIGFSSFLRKWFFIILAIFGGVVILFLRYIKTESGKEKWHNVLFRVPKIKDFVKMIYLSRFAENLSVLISAGMPLPQALKMTGDVVGNVTFKQIIFESKEVVKRGGKISSVLKKYPELFPPLVTQMTLVGEKTGTLDKSLMNVVNFYEEEIERTTESLLKILEPILIIFLGLLVAGVMASILIPLYKVVI